jgi:hypothetical protein
VRNTWEKPFKKRKDLFWLLVSEVTVHGQLAPLLLGLQGGRTSWQKDVIEQNCSISLCLGSEEVETECFG